MANLWLFGSRTRLPSIDGLRWDAGLGDPTVFWYENPGWERYEIASVPHVSEGGPSTTSPGRDDLVIGQSIHYRNLYWFEQPANPREEWRRHLITDAFEMYHDIAFGDVDGDGSSGHLRGRDGTRAAFGADSRST